jgi:HK97 gp10 family phage protein
VKIRVQGLAESRGQLANLGEGIELRVLRRATKAAAEVIKQKEIQGARRVEDSGLLADSIRLHMESDKRQAKVRAHIRPSGKPVMVEQTGPDGVKRERRTRASAYAHLVEFGSQHVPPRPFIRPAVESTAAARDAAFAAEVEKGVARELKRRTRVSKT